MNHKESERHVSLNKVIVLSSLELTYGIQDSFFKSSEELSRWVQKIYTSLLPRKEKEDKYQHLK